MTTRHEKQQGAGLRSQPGESRSQRLLLPAVLESWASLLDLMTLQLVGTSLNADGARSGFARSLLWFSRTWAAVALATLEFRVCKEEEEEEKSSSSSSPMSQASLVLRANSWKLEAFLLFAGSALALERSLMKLEAREKQHQSSAVRPTHFLPFPVSYLRAAGP